MNKCSALTNCFGLVLVLHMPSYIQNIGSALPHHKISQNAIAKFMSAAMELNENESQRLQKLLKATGIESRHSVLEDFGLSCSSFSFFPKNELLEPFPTTSQRMAKYKDCALPLAVNAIEDCTTNTPLNKVTHLITVSCTGMYAPGIDIDLVNELGLNSSVERTCINFMGCYAAFNALKVADNICRANPGATVLLVCVELSSLHFQKHKTYDNMISSALFGDGAAAAIMHAKPAEGINLQIEKAFCLLAPEGIADMAWHVQDHGFEMTLSSYIPQLLEDGLGNLLNGIFNNGVSQAEIDHYVIHPGGVKILKACEEVLGIESTSNLMAYEVLKACGNMSSATVLFVMQKLMASLSARNKGEKVLSLAFGPGLTLESLILNVEHVQ